MADLETIVTPHAVVSVDLRHGGSIVHFGATAAPADNVLASFPQAPAGADTSAFGASQAEWLATYRGGWQLLTPSAGAASIVNGVSHEFHGEVSAIEWMLERSSPASMQIRAVARDSLTVTRTLSLDGRRLSVTTTIENGSSSEVPAIVVEHIAFAGGEDARVVAPRASGWVSPTDRATTHPWPSGLDTPIPPGGDRVVSLVEGGEGWIELRRERGTIRVDWNPAELLYLWYWQERLSPGFPFYGGADIVGLEPSSVRFGDGLAAAIDRGEAWWLAPGEARTVTVGVSLAAGTAPASSPPRAETAG